MNRRKLAKPPDGLAAHLVPIWREMESQVQEAIGSAGLEALVVQVHRMRDAQERITAEGIVVADSKGNPIPHPALAIERQAQVEIRTWLAKYGGRYEDF